MFRKFFSTVVIMLLIVTAFASPPNSNENKTKTKANDNALMTTADTDMSSPPPTLQVWTDSTAIVRNGENGTVHSTGENKRNESVSSPAVAATNYFCSECFVTSYMTNMTASTDITATTDDKEESSPAAAATNYFCSEHTSYMTNMTAETAPTTSTSTQMGHLATEGDFPLKFI